MRNTYGLLLLISLALVASTLHGQNDVRTSLSLSPGSRFIIHGKVQDIAMNAVSGAKVSTSFNSAVYCRNAQTDKKGEFRIECDVPGASTEVEHITIPISVWKQQFEDTHKLVDVSQSAPSAAVLITLRRLQPEDPTLLSQSDLINNLAPRMRRLTAEDNIAEEDRKSYESGIMEFFDNKKLENGIAILSTTVEKNPSCYKCRTMLSLAELAWGDWEDAHRELKAAVGAMMADGNRLIFEPLLAYGVYSSWERDPVTTSVYLSEALKLAPQDALVLQEYGRVKLLDFDWVAACDALDQAVALGAGPESKLLLAEALLGAGMADQAAAQLNSFLSGRSVREMPLGIQILSDRIQYQRNNRRVFPASRKAGVPTEKYIDYLHNPPQDLPDFEPAKSQESIGSILALVGNNVSKLFANLLNISAREKIQLEKLSKEDEAEPGQNFENLYLCMGAVDKNNPSFDEYRSDLEGHEISRLGLNNGYMLTSGFVAAPLIFHPLHQNGSTFRLLGYQKLNGRDTIVMAFAQLPTRSRMSGSFQFGGNAETTFKQGMVWIDAQNYQILRLVSDLLTPIPWVGLDRVKTQIDFSEIHFDRKSFTFWLPVKVVVTVAWNGKVLRNTHTYSDFRLFDVEVSVKMAAPSGADQPAEKTGNTNTPGN